MCRHFFIFEHSLSLNEMKHILSKQIAKKDTPGLINPRDDGPHDDGFGISYQTSKKTWKTKKWLEKSDEEVIQMMDEITRSKIVIIHLRRNCSLGKRCRISSGKVSLENTHPFSYKDAVFTHNGNIRDFGSVKKHLRKFIADDLFLEIKGETDSEWIFYMFLTSLRKYKKFEDIHVLLEEMIKNLSSICSEFSLNIIFSNKDFSLITRYIHYDKSEYTKKQSPNSLYYDTSKGLVISSEPISKKYKMVPENSMIILDHSTKEAYLTLSLNK